jgi:hypothetical protein
MDETRFEKDLAEMLARKGAPAPPSLRDSVAGIPSSKPISPSLAVRLRSAARLAGALATSVIAVAVLGFALVQRDAGRASVPVGALSAPGTSFVSVCGQALLIVKIGHSGSTVTFADPATGRLAASSSRRGSRRGSRTGARNWWRRMEPWSALRARPSSSGALEARTRKPSVCAR